VARLAGVPPVVIGAARRYLAELEAQRDAHAAMVPSPQAALPFDAPPQQPATDALREKLAAVEPDNLSPREAQALLYELRGLLDRG
jgi:DNA mismatch repair protein MutS